MDSTTAELLFREMISVNLLSVHVAISDWCAELAQQISVHSSLYRIHSFEHDQIHIRDLESDLNAWTCALQLTPFFGRCPLKTAQRAGHRFTLIFIEHGSGAAVLSWFALERGVATGEC